MRGVDWVTIVIGFVLWIWAAIAQARDNSLIDLAHAIGDVTNTLKGPFEQLKRSTGLTSTPVNLTDPRLSQSVENIIKNMKQFMKKIALFLLGESKNLLEQFEEDETKRGVRILGSFISLIALVFFLYADAAQGANNLSLIFQLPDGAIPTFLTNLVIPLIISSAGSALMLGFIIADCLEITHFTILSDIKPGTKTKKLTLGTAVFAFVLTLLFSGMLALDRFALLTNRVSWIDITAKAAQSLIIIPLLLTTFLLFYGLHAFLVITAFLLLTLAAIFHVLAGSFGIIELAIKTGVIGVEWTTTFFIMLLHASVYVIVMFIDILNKIFTKVVTVIIMIILAPPLALIQRLIQPKDSTTASIA